MKNFGKLFFVMTAFIAAQSGVTSASVIYTDIGTFGGEHFYVGVSTSPLTWDQANSIATGDGYQLAVVDTAAENNYVFSQIVGNPSFYGGTGGLQDLLGPWLGGYSDTGSATSWNWVDGSQTSTLFSSFGPATWGSGQPDNAENGSATNGLLYYNGNSLGVAGSALWGDYGYNPNLGAPIAFVVETPEPSTFALAGLGGIGLAIGAYRRRKAAAAV